MKSFAITIFFFTATLYSGNSVANCNICSDEDDLYKKSICLYYHSRDNVNNTEESINIMNCLINMWGNRGAAGGTLISNAFLFQLEKFPSNFFVTMESHEAIYSEWLNKLNDYSFVWYKSTPSKLEEKQARFISMLNKYKTKTSMHSRMKEKLLSTLYEIKSRVVD